MSKKAWYHYSTFVVSDIKGFLATFSNWFQRISILYETHIGSRSNHCSSGITFVLTMPNRSSSVYTKPPRCLRFTTCQSSGHSFTKHSELNADYHLSFKLFKITRRHLQCKNFFFHSAIWGQCCFKMARRVRKPDLYIFCSEKQVPLVQKLPTSCQDVLGGHQGIATLMWRCSAVAREFWVVARMWLSGYNTI